MEAWERREMLTEKLQEHLERMRMNKQANEEMKEQVEGARCQLEYFHRLRDKLTDEVCAFELEMAELKFVVSSLTLCLSCFDDVNGLRITYVPQEVTWRNKIDELEREVEEETRQLEVEEDQKFDDVEMKHLIEAVEAKKQEVTQSSPALTVFPEMTELLQVGEQATGEGRS